MEAEVVDSLWFGKHTNWCGKRRKLSKPVKFFDGADLDGDYRYVRAISPERDHNRAQGSS